MLFLFLHTASQEITPENFYLVHSCRSVQPEKIMGRSFCAITTPGSTEAFNPNRDVILRSKLTDNRAIGHYGLNIAGSHELRISTPQKYPFTILIRLEAVLRQILEGTADDIQVALDVKLPDGTIILGPKEAILGLKPTPDAKLSALYPGISFKALSSFETLTHEELREFIRTICFEKGRYFVDVPCDYNAESDRQQELMLANPETRQVFVYKLYTGRGARDMEDYRKNPINYVAKNLQAPELARQRMKEGSVPAHILKKVLKPDDFSIRIHTRPGHSFKIPETELIKKLLGPDKKPVTDFEGIWRRYETHLASLGELIAHPLNYKLFIDGAFEGLEIQNGIPVKGRLSRQYLAQIQEDWRVLRARLAEKVVDDTSARRFAEFSEHQESNIQCLRNFSFSERNNLNKIFTGVWHWCISRDGFTNPAMKTVPLDLVVAAFQSQYPCDRGLWDTILPLIVAAKPIVEHIVEAMDSMLGFVNCRYSDAEISALKTTKEFKFMNDFANRGHTLEDQTPSTKPELNLAQLLQSLPPEMLEQFLKLGASGAR